jgi:hypothetical protein
MVTNFDYTIINKINDTSNTSSKIKRSADLVKNHRKNLDELIVIVSNLKGAVLSEKNTLESKIKKLYELIKTKLGNDLFLFNILIVTKFLQGYKYNGVETLDKSIKILFDTILAEIEVELKKVLLNYNLLPNLFYSINKLKEILNSTADTKVKDSDHTENIKILSYIYIHTILKNRYQSDFHKQLFIFERILAEHIADFKQRDKNKYMLKSLPEALTQDEPKSKIRSTIYVYFITYISELEQEVNSLSNKLKISQTSFFESSNKVNLLEKEVKEKDITIHQLTEQGIEKDETINKLQIEKTEICNRNEYELKTLKREFENLETDIVKELQDKLKLKLDDLSRFANGLQQNDGEFLKIYINKIHQVLETL